MAAGAVFLMFFFSLDEGSGGDAIILDYGLSFGFLMTVSIDDFLLKFRRVGASHAIERKAGVASPAEKSLRGVSAEPVFFGLIAFAVDAGDHWESLQFKVFKSP